MILTVLLTILKILGIILAVILGLLIILILLALFVPIRYKLSFARTGVDGDPAVQAKGYVSYLLHIIHVSAEYPYSDCIITVRVFGIPVVRFPAAQSDKPAKEKKSKDIKKDKKDKKDKNTNDRDASGNNEEQNKEDASETSDQDTSETSNQDPHRKTISDIINSIKCTYKGIYDKIVALVHKLQDKATLAADKSKELKKNIHYYHTILTSELFERTFEKCKKKVFRLLKSILPRKLEVCIEAGFDDPYTTGELLAISSMLIPVWGDHVRVIGNFEEVIIRGAGKLKGRIYGFSFLKIALYYFFDRDLKRLIRLLKKEEKKRGRK